MSIKTMPPSSLATRYTLPVATFAQRPQTNSIMFCDSPCCGWLNQRIYPARASLIPSKARDSMQPASVGTCIFSSSLIYSRAIESHPTHVSAASALPFTFLSPRHYLCHVLLSSYQPLVFTVPIQIVKVLNNEKTASSAKMEKLFFAQRNRQET